MPIKRSFLLAVTAVLSAVATATVGAPAANAASVSQSVSVPAVPGAEFCLEVDGEQTCTTILGLTGGTLTITLSGDAAGTGPTITPDPAPAKCAGRPGAGIVVSTGSFNGVITASLTGQHPATGEPVAHVLGHSINAQNHTAATTVCQQ